MPYGTVNADVIQSSVSGVSLGAGNATVFKNRIINGDMRIDQRNAGTSITPTTNGTYCVDRFRLDLSQASKFSMQQNQGSVTPPNGYINYQGLTSLSAYSSSSGDYFLLRQAIEGLNVSDLGWGGSSAKTVTLSFQVYSSVTGTHSGSLCNASQNRSYPFTFTVSSANTWTSISVTVPGDTTGTWLTTNGVGIWVNWNMGCGSTYLGTANTWGAAAYFGATGSVSLVGTNGATFYITGVQLEVGSSATGFEYRDIGRELQLCQRYFEMSYDIGVKPGTAASYGSNISTFPATYAVYFTADFRVTKRTSATITWYSPYSGASGYYGVNNASDAVINGLTSGTNSCGSYTATLPGNVSAYVHYTANAEL